MSDERSGRAGIRVLLVLVAVLGLLAMALAVVRIANDAGAAVGSPANPVTVGHVQDPVPSSADPDAPRPRAACTGIHARTGWWACPDGYVWRDTGTLSTTRRTTHVHRLQKAKCLWSLICPPTNVYAAYYNH